MKTCPAIALLEYETLAAGLRATDLMLKKAPIALVKCGSIHPGRYLVLIGGTVASTIEAHHEGLMVETPIDDVLLPDIHPEVYEALLGRREMPAGDGLGVLETDDSCALLRAADAVMKGVEVQVVEIRLAEDLHGRALLLISGSLAELESALDLAETCEGVRAHVRSRAVLPRLDDDFRQLLGVGSRFRDCPSHRPESAETTEDGRETG